MSATATMPENPTSLDQGSRHAIVVDCRAGTARPRWDLITESFYQRFAGIEEVLTVAPLFHVKPDAPPFSLCLELQGAVFAPQFPDTSFHVTHPEVQPVSLVWNDRRHVQVTWSGPGSEVSDWGRWVYRFYVEEEGNPLTRRPVYLAFTYLPDELKPDLLNGLMPPPPPEPPAAAVPIRASEWKLSIGIELSIDGDPVFRNLFRYGDDVDLPEGVYLEPLIVVKETGKWVDIEFTTGGNILFAGEAYECDPGVADQNPLALVWRAVTDPKKGCAARERISARGFEASWCDPESGSATVRWMEPPGGDVSRRASSFFFVNQGIKGEGDPNQTGSFHTGSALVDPTVIHDQDSPPGG